MTVESSTENAQASNDELQAALYHTDRWLRKITKTIKSDAPDDEESREKLATQLKRAQRQVRANKPLLEGVREQFGFGKSGGSGAADDEDYRSFGDDE
jgi:hypothetical protein